MTDNKKQKLIAGLKELKQPQLTKKRMYFEQIDKQELFCFNGYMYHSLYPKLTFKTLMGKRTGTMSKALTEELFQEANRVHYEYSMGRKRFKTAVNNVIKEINQL